MRTLPTHRPPIHPGEILLEEFLKPLGVSQAAFARRIGVSFPRLTEVIHRRRGVTVNTALRLARALGTTPDLWLTMQRDWDLWHALLSVEGKGINRIMPLYETPEP